MFVSFLHTASLSRCRCSRRCAWV